MPAWNYQNVGSSIVDTLAQIAAEKELRQRQAEAAVVAAQTRDRDYGLKVGDLNLREKTQATNERIREDAATEAQRVHDDLERGRSATRGANQYKTALPGGIQTDQGQKDMEEAGVMLPTEVKKAPTMDVGGAGYLMLGVQPAATEKDKRAFSVGGADWQMARERADENKVLAAANAQARAEADAASDNRDRSLRTELQASENRTRTEIAAAGNASREAVAATREGDSVGDLTPASLDMLARAVAVQGLSALSGLGMGTKAVDMRKRVLDRAAQFDVATGKFADVENPNQNPPDLAAARGDYTANQSALTQLERQSRAVSAFATTADANAARLEQIMKTVPETGIPLLNRPVRALDARLFGDENVVALQAIQQSVRNEYARLISQPNLTGVLSDSARKEMESALAGDMTVQQMQRVLKELAAEAQNRSAGFEKEIDGVRSKMRAPAQTATPALGSQGAAPGTGTPQPPRVRTYNPATGKLE